MLKITVEQASRDLKVILKQVAEGEEVLLIDRDQVVARLVPPQTLRNQPPQNRESWIADMRLFRAKIESDGEALSSTVARMRIEERY
jgi:antitoxin (DNA-binding transcriptional repressor) of toxin-antitoxin stability system